MDHLNLVYDYKSEPEHMVVWKDVTEMDILQLDESIRKTIDFIKYYDNHGWETRPKYELCRLCSILHCKDKITDKPPKETYDE